MKYTLLFGLYCMMLNAVANECQQVDCAFNPKPANGDFILPMPGNMQMVFRQVIVPGKEFWGSDKRIINVGDIRGEVGDEAVFEGTQRLPITGAFFDNQNWFYYLGKYEVTIGQYAMVMGEGNLEKGLTYFYSIAGDKDQVKELQEAISNNAQIKLNRSLAKPLAYISWFDHQDFIRKYNDWCFSNAECLGKLPRLPERLTGSSAPSDSPGFFRLPTELEWEYAARGGWEAMQQKRNGIPIFEQKLPFEFSQLPKYVWTKTQGKGTARIGRLEPIYGFYDLLGNVQEMTANFFTTELIQGKVGGLCGRGGSYNDADERIRISQRTELSIYQSINGKVQAAKLPTSGIRLVIGSLVVQTPRYKDDIQQQYETYLQTVKRQTPSGQSTQSSFTQASDIDLKKAQQILTAMAANYRNDENLANQINNVNLAIQSAQKTIDEGIKKIIQNLTTNAIIVLKTAGWHYFRSEISKELLDKIQNMNISGRSAQIAEQQRRQEEALEGFNSNFEHYAQTVDKLKEFYQSHATEVHAAIAAFEKQYSHDRPYIEVCKLLRKHLKSPSHYEKWKQEVKTMASLTQKVYQNR